MQKRNIPRHIDDGIVVFRLKFKNFLIFTAILIIFVIINLILENLIFAIISLFFIAILYILLVAIKKESNYKIIKDEARLKLEGTMYFQRNTLKIDVEKRSFKRGENDVRED